MYRIKLTSGEEVAYKSPEELTTAVQSGVVTADAHIYHQRANKWLEIAMHPHFRLAQNGWSRSPRPVRPARPVTDPQMPAIEPATDPATPDFELLKQPVFDIPQGRKPLPDSVRVKQTDDGLVLLMPEMAAPRPAEPGPAASPPARPRPNLDLRLDPASAPARRAAPVPKPAPSAKVDLGSVPLSSSMPLTAIEIAPVPEPARPVVSAAARPSRALPSIHQVTESKPEPILGLTHETSPLDLMPPSVTASLSRHAEPRESQVRAPRPSVRSSVMTSPEPHAPRQTDRVREPRDSLIRVPRPSVRSKIMTSPELHAPQQVEPRSRISRLAVAGVVVLLGAGLPLVAWHPWETKAPVVGALLSLTQPAPALAPPSQTTSATSIAPTIRTPAPLSVAAQAAPAPAPAPAPVPVRVSTRPAFGGGPVTPSAERPKPAAKQPPAAAATAPAPTPAPDPDSATAIPAAPSVDLSGSAAPTITPAQLTHSYATAYSDANAELEQKMTESGVLLLAGKPKPAAGDSLERATQSVAAATGAIKSYQARIQQIEQAYADTLQQVGRTLGLSPEELKAWDFRGSRKEPAEAHQTGQTWQAKVDEVTEILSKKSSEQ